MTRLVLLSDTHIPKRARDLPANLWREIESADLVIHAGDWVDLETLDTLERRSRSVLAVYGNNDGPELQARLPEVARKTVDGVRIAVVHETGPASNRERRMDAAFGHTDLLVFGHSHIPWDTVTPEGMRLLNPGSPTDRRRQPVGTFMTVDIDGTEVRDVRLVAVSA